MIKDTHSVAADFTPHPLLRHPHLMTVMPRFRAQRTLLNGITAQPRLFDVASNARLLGYCHWQPDPRQHPTVVLVHGLEGCSESHYMLGIAAKACRAGFNVIRLNQRNCGGTDHLSSTLYHSGLSGDLASVIAELWAREGLACVWVVGYSMGGNLALKMAGEAKTGLAALRGIVAVCPNLDPAACVAALERPANWFYQRYFLRRLKARLQRKARLFPDKYDPSPLPGIRTLRAFDEAYTAPDGGFASAEDYYERAAARHVLPDIHVPTLILAAQDDPFIPYPMFQQPAIHANPRIHLCAPASGGHCGFYQRPRPGEDAYWAENRLVEWIVTAWKK